MGVWDTILKYGGKAAKGMGKAAGATGKSVGQAVIHPSQTLRGAGQAVKTATIGGAVGYVGWEKLTTDKSVARIVSEAVIGESATNTLAGTTEEVKELKDKAGEAMDAVGETVSGIGTRLDGASNFLRETSGGGILGMFGNFFRNLGQGNVGTEHGRTDSGSVPRVRPYRLARQDCRPIPGHDAHREQLGRSTDSPAAKPGENASSVPLPGGTDTERRDEKIGT